MVGGWAKLLGLVGWEVVQNVLFGWVFCENLKKLLLDLLISLFGMVNGGGLY